MDAGVPAESIDVNLKLTSLKALHASWLIELYNVLTTADGREAVLKPGFHYTANATTTTQRKEVIRLSSHPSS